MCGCGCTRNAQVTFIAIFQIICGVVVLTVFAATGYYEVNPDRKLELITCVGATLVCLILPFVLLIGTHKRSSAYCKVWFYPNFFGVLFWMLNLIRQLTMGDGGNALFSLIGILISCVFLYIVSSYVKELSDKPVGSVQPERKSESMELVEV